MTSKSESESLQENSPNLVAASTRLRNQRNFTRVPNEIINHPDLSAKAKMIWIKLWSYCYEGDTSFPGMEVLADSLNCGEGTVRRHRRKLEEAGLLEVTQRGLTKTNIYKLFCPEPVKSGVQEPIETGDEEDKDNNNTNNSSKEGQKPIPEFYKEEPDKSLAKWKAPDFVKYLCFSYFQKFGEKIPPRWGQNGDHFKRCLNCQDPEVVKKCLDKLFSVNGKEVTNAAWVYNALDDFIAGKLDSTRNYMTKEEMERADYSDYDKWKSKDGIVTRVEKQLAEESKSD